MKTGGERGDSAMRAATKKTDGTTGTRLLAILAFLVTLFATATPTAQATTPSPDTQAAYLAEQLRTNPVYVTDQLPREIPKSTTPAFTKLAKRTGVPTYVLVLPIEAADGEALLGTVHDRLGKDGLYVLIDDSSVTDATAYGVTAPADDALTTAQYELPFDAGPLRSFERFVDVVAEGGAKAATRAQAARDKYDAEGEPAEMYIGPSDRDNQSFLTGMAITGVPLAMLLLSPYVRRWWRRRPGAPVSLNKRTQPGRWRRHLLPAAAVATAAAIAAAAPQVFDQTTSSASPRPRAIDLNARIDRVAEALSQDPIYQDPESPRALDKTQLAQLHTHIEKFRSSEAGGPVFMALVPQLYEDESGSDEEYFAHAVHDKLGKDGVYIVADPLDGYINVFDHGLGLDTYDLLNALPESVIYGDEKSNDADDHLLGERLTKVMTALDKTERTEDLTTSDDDEAYPFTDPITEDELNPLFYGDFWPGLTIGALAAGALFALVAAALGIARKSLLRRHPEPLQTSTLPTTSPAMPTKPYLRDTARTELQAMAREYGTGERADARARNRYEATMLLTADSGNVDDDLSPSTLTALIILARATRAALAGDDSTLCCGVNPLHGPAKTSRHVRTSSVETRRRMLPVCEICLDDPHKIPARLLKLPPNGRPYYEDELLSAVPDGFTKLGRKVREAAHAQ
ncbi:hypothetical protein [Streptomyces justiciae]|uniref:hypothetical protein n=1 Tax=Streptomyces justiciae TaxID=2780140 RepID=UPI002117E9DF|nr:hypothetical protein [Streptomyces justiciae]MCW8379525.1 hypothetical protein [Streptomyces justiciae]